MSQLLIFFRDINLRLEFSPILPPENNSFDVFKNAVDWSYQDQDLTVEYPMISNSMHAWYGTFRLPYKYEELRKRFELLSDLENVWHCNQNEYAAYRRQKRVSKLSQIKKSSREISVELTRPTLLSLNDSTPLTLSVSNIAPEQVELVACNTAKVIVSDHKMPNKLMFHIEHNEDQNLPRKIGNIANPKNVSLEELADDCDPDFPDICGSLMSDGDYIHLHLRNEGNSALENMFIHWRSPIGWKVEEAFEKIEECAAGDTIKLSKKINPLGPQLQRLGKAHFAAQLDFLTDDVAGRIHFTCQKPGGKADNSFPQSGFSLLGPIPNEKIDVDQFVNLVLGEGCPEEFVIDQTNELKWQKDARNGYVTHDWLNPEYVRTMGTWDHESQTYLLRTKIHSDIEQDAKILISHSDISTIILNGIRVESEPVKLLEGENKVVIIYPGCKMSIETQRLSACFFRVANPENNKRLLNLQYEAY